VISFATRDFVSADKLTSRQMGYATDNSGKYSNIAPMEYVLQQSSPVNYFDEPHALNDFYKNMKL
jgi:hypothetical protein